MPSLFARLVKSNYILAYNYGQKAAYPTALTHDQKAKNIYEKVQVEQHVSVANAYQDIEHYDLTRQYHHLSHKIKSTILLSLASHGIANVALPIAVLLAILIILFLIIGRKKYFSGR